MMLSNQETYLATAVVDEDRWEAAEAALLVVEHDASEQDRGEDAALRRLDRRCALLVAAVSTAGFGFLAGRAARPAGQPVPEAWLLVAAGGLLIAAAAVVAVVVSWRCWRAWWPYRHNRVLGNAAELGCGVPAGDEVSDGR